MVVRADPFLGRADGLVVLRARGFISVSLRPEGTKVPEREGRAWRRELVR